MIYIYHADAHLCLSVICDAVAVLFGVPIDAPVRLLKVDIINYIKS